MSQHPNVTHWTFDWAAKMHLTLVQFYVNKKVCGGGRLIKNEGSSEFGRWTQAPLFSLWYAVWRHFLSLLSMFLGHWFFSLHPFHYLLRWGRLLFFKHTATRTNPLYLSLLPLAPRCISPSPPSHDRPWGMTVAVFATVAARSNDF